MVKIPNNNKNRDHFSIAVKGAQRISPVRRKLLNPLGASGLDEKVDGHRDQFGIPPVGGGKGTPRLTSTPGHIIRMA